MRNLAVFGTHHNGDYASVPKTAKSHILIAFFDLMTNSIA